MDRSENATSDSTLVEQPDRELNEETRPAPNGGNLLPTLVIRLVGPFWRTRTRGGW